MTTASQCTTQSTRSIYGPLSALMGPAVAIVLIFSFGCAAAVGDCVATYEFEGTVRKGNYTRAECEAECEAVGRWLTCGWEGRSQSPMGVEPRVDFGSRS